MSSTSILTNTPREFDYPAMIAATIGGLAVGASYTTVFANEYEGYFDSRFWLKIPRSTTKAICYGLQLPAGVGYLVFLAYATGLVGKGPATKGVLQYWGKFGLTVSVTLFSIASVLWPLLTKLHLDQGWGVGWPVASLLVAAMAAIIMTAGAFEADLEWPAVLGVLVLSCVVVMADAVGWNAKLLYHHANPKF